MKCIVVANWKMNPTTFKEAKRLFDATKKIADAAKSASVIVAPPAIYLRELRASYKGSRVSFAAQSARAEMGGAHTGEISLAQAKDAGASYVIVGHSERRAEGESNDDTRKKIAAALSLGLTPILAVGETRRFPSGEHFAFIKEQIRAGFADVAPAKAGKVVVAYEPVWTIGGEEALAPRDMHEMAIFIRKSITELLGEKGMSVKILYGGAATESNAAMMLRDGDVAGLLVGHVSVDPARFATLLQSIGTPQV